MNREKRSVKMVQENAASRVVLITGCSSGIGRATALRLAKGPYTVYATARNPATLRELEAAGCRLLALDVTDERSMVAAVEAIEREHGAVWALINNAGYSQSGALETVPIDKVRRQFETNVFGALRLAQLVLPGMRRQGRGRIINVSSMGGTLTFPGGGVYHGSKYALEALSDALRYEVAPFGVQVVVIQPGLIRTGFAEAALTEMKDVPAEAGPYTAFNAAVGKATRDVYEAGPMAKLGGDPDDVAAVIERALEKGHPAARYPVTPSARMFMWMRSLMPDGIWDAFLRSQFPQPSASKREQ